MAKYEVGQTVFLRDNSQFEVVKIHDVKKIGYQTYDVKDFSGNEFFIKKEDELYKYSSIQVGDFYFRINDIVYLKSYRNEIFEERHRYMIKEILNNPDGSQQDMGFENYICQLISSPEDPYHNYAKSNLSYSSTK